MVIKKAPSAKSIKQVSPILVRRPIFLRARKNNYVSNSLKDMVLMSPTAVAKVRDKTLLLHKNSATTAVAKVRGKTLLLHKNSATTKSLEPVVTRKERKTFIKKNFNVVRRSTAKEIKDQEDHRDTIMKKRCQLETAREYTARVRTKSIGNGVALVKNVRPKGRESDPLEWFLDRKYPYRLKYSIQLEEIPCYGAHGFVCKQIPVHHLTQLIISIKSQDLSEIDKYMTFISAGNENKKAADHFMFHWRKPGDFNHNSIAKSGRYWLESDILTTQGKLCLEGFMEAINVELSQKTKQEYEMAVGLLRTNVSSHQDAEVGDTEVYILHVPLDPEGLTLRLGIETDEEDNLSPFSSMFVHVPFGSFILLHHTQWHAGHYGQQGSLRLHGVFHQGVFKDNRLIQRV